MISKIKFTSLLTNFHRKVKYCKCLILFYCHQIAIGDFSEASVLSCIVLYCRSLSSMAQPFNEGLTLETSALKTLYPYGGQFALSSHFIMPNFPFNSTLNHYIGLKSFVICLFVSYDFFLITSLFKFSIDLKILWRTFFQAGLTRRRTFRVVTHSYSTIFCVGGMLYLGRKKHNVIRKRKILQISLDFIFSVIYYQLTRTPANSIGLLSRNIYRSILKLWALTFPYLAGLCGQYA